MKMRTQYSEELNEIEAAFKTTGNTAILFWQRHGSKAPSAEDHIRFPIVPDGKFRRYRVKLGGEETYKGAMIRLRLDPADSGAEGDFIKLKSVQLKAGS